MHLHKQTKQMPPRGRLEPVGWDDPVLNPLLAAEIDGFGIADTAMEDWWLDDISIFDRYISISQILMDLFQYLNCLLDVFQFLAGKMM